ncbi:hypothetical protein F5X71_19960 [Nocardia brasiliensis]|uniref:Terpene synthase n=1 Tax=Nocardia brasiliensis TaxID=37326 RepID=A0A6G9XTQ1_NOCBR|nr:hypothetical protein [Nocardia brasiliensis]QIS04304.1 hypothetical protein F5X71_19960 [Nocardia brasiliensis]
MSTPLLPVVHGFTGIGTAAADVRRLLGIDPAVSKMGESGAEDFAAVSDGIDATAAVERMDGAGDQVAASESVHLDQSRRRLLRSAAPRSSDRSAVPDSQAGSYPSGPSGGTADDFSDRMRRAASLSNGRRGGLASSSHAPALPRSSDLVEFLEEVFTRERLTGSGAGGALDIPPIWCPLELFSYGDGLIFQLGSEEFFRKMGLGDDLLKSARSMCTGDLACMYGSKSDDEGVQLMSDWLMWALLFDDYYCDSGPYTRDPTAYNHAALNLMQYAIDPERGPIGDHVFDGLAAALADIMARVRARTPAEHAAMISMAHFRWALGASCGVSDRSGNYMRSLDEHMIARGPDGGGPPLVLLVETLDRTCLDFVTRNTPEVRAMTAATGLLFALSTDIPSYARECDEHSLESNVVGIIATENRCSRQEAIYRACALVEEITELFVTLKHKLAKDGTPALRDYLEHLSNMIRGTLEWQRRLPRYYASLDGAGQPISTGRLSDNAIHDVSPTRLFPHIAPPESIRWWWNYI